MYVTDSLPYSLTTSHFSLSTKYPLFFNRFGHSLRFCHLEFDKEAICNYFEIFPPFRRILMTSQRPFSSASDSFIGNYVEISLVIVSIISIIIASTVKLKFVSIILSVIIDI